MLKKKEVSPLEKCWIKNFNL